MKSIAAIGFCCIDYYSDRNLWYPTGNGIDCIAHLAKRGIRCSAVSIVGNDDFGKAMLTTLESMGINTSHMQQEKGDTSLFEMQLTETNDRVHVRNIPGVMENYIPTKADIEFTAKHDYIHTDLFGKVLGYLPDLKKYGAKLVLDFSVYANDENMKELLPYVDYAFFSVGEGNEEKAYELLKKAKSFGGSVMTATLGEDGSICYDGESFYVGKAVPAKEVVNTVGAGDSFIAGFTEGVMQGKSIPECMENGAQLASTIVAQFNPY